MRRVYGGSWGFRNGVEAHTITSGIRVFFRE